MSSSGVITLKVFSGGFVGGNSKYSATGDISCKNIPDFDRDYLSYFELRDTLKEYGLKEDGRLYYLKPGYRAPDGLVLICDDNQCIQLLAEHDGRSCCSLYIVPDPTGLAINSMNHTGSPSRSEPLRHTTPVQLEDGDQAGNIESSSDDESAEDETYKHTGLGESGEYLYDDDLEPEHDAENRAVDLGGHVFEGDVGDDDLYSIKNQKAMADQGAGGAKAGKEPAKEKVSARSIRKEKRLANKTAAASSSGNKKPEVTYLSDEPDDGNHTADEAYDTPIYVHRSRGIEDNWFDENALRSPVVEVGMLFTDVGQFRDALKNLIIREGRKVEKRKNDPKKVSARCLGEGCGWYIYGAVIPGEKIFKCRKFVKEHTCGRSHDVKQMDAKWIAKEYVEDFRSDRDWKVKHLKDSVLRDTQIGISKYKAYRAKREAVKMVLGDHLDQFKRIQDYAHTLLQVNPGSKVIVKCDVSEQLGVNPMFERMFISFKAQIDGFKAGCRPFIGVDGTHVKLPNGAQILAATGRDANNNMYPLAFALAESENNKSWEWFLNCLKDCIGDGQEHGGWVFMSDRQKGILEGIPKVFPTAEEREKAKERS